MAKAKRIACPYCGKKAEDDAQHPGGREIISHKFGCKLAMCAGDPRSLVPDCPADLLEVDHGMVIELFS